MRETGVYKAEYLDSGQLRNPSEVTKTHAVNYKSLLKGKFLNKDPKP